VAAAGDPRQHVIYRGCTHPATYFGVPIEPFVFSVLVFALPGLWLLRLSFYAALTILLLYIPVFVVLRGVSRKDPYTLIQLGYRFRLRFGDRNKRRWGAVTHTPFRY
jgi:type IV secretory pathway VirB3-like protein